MSHSNEKDHGVHPNLGDKEVKEQVDRLLGEIVAKVTKNNYKLSDEEKKALCEVLFAAENNKVVGRTC